MVDEVKKTIRTDLVVDADKAIQEAKKFRQQVDEIKTELRSLQEQTGQSLDIVSEAFKRVNISPLKDQVKALKAELSSLQEFRAGVIGGGGGSPEIVGQLDTEIASVTTQLGYAEGASKATSQAMRELKQETTATEKSMFDLGNVAQRVFRSIIGFVVLNILRQLLGLYNDVTRAGKEFADSMLEISSAVQSLQRSGIDITMAEVADEVTRLGEKFQVFTTRDLNSGLAALFDIGRQLGFTKEQMFALADATAFLAQKNNKEFTPSINQVTTALVNGQTRGLKGLDLAISEQQIKEEAYRLELAKVGEQLDANVKAQALYSLILQEAGRQSGSLAEIEELLSIQYKSEESTLKDLKDAIGTQLLPTKIALYKIVNQLITAFYQFHTLIGSSVSKTIDLFNNQLGVTLTILGLLRDIITGDISAVKELGDAFAEGLKNIQDFFKTFAVIGDQEGLGLSDLPEELRNTADDVGSAGDELVDEFDSLFQKLRESIIDGNQDIAKENRKFLDDLTEDLLRYGQKLRELASKLAFDRAKIERDYANKVASINQKYRDRELDNEQKFQDKLRSLRAKFLFDLEDALAERDARQIIRLIRQFRLNQDELKRQRDSERRDIDEERQRELRDLQLQREQRLNELNLEYQFRRQKLAEEFAFERKLAQMDHEQKLREIQIQTKERNEELIRRYSDEYAITDTFAKAIRERLNAEFGPDGQIEAIYNYFIEMTENTFEYLSEVLKRLNRIPGQLRKATPQTGVGGGSYGSPGGFAEGGTLVANKPTLALFGEGGPERVDFSPLTRPGANVGRVFGGTLPASLMEEKLLSIMISLSPGLEAEIVEKSLGQMADVIIDTNRQRL